MRKRMILTILFLFSTFAYSKTSIAVLNIKSSKVEKSDLTAVTNFVTTELSKYNQFKIISWDDVAKMLEYEARKQLLGCDDEKCISEIGGALGVDYILAGDMGGLGTNYIFNLKVIDINKAVTMSRVSETVSGDLGLFIDKIPNMIKELLKIQLVISSNEPEIKNNSESEITTVTDIDGNVYNTVKIGGQIWTVENLKVTKYNDGTPIYFAKENSNWEHCKDRGAYCFYPLYYKEDERNEFKYGALYNWYAVNSGKLAPKGWHVPTEEEWKQLLSYIMYNMVNQDWHKVRETLISDKDWSKIDKKNNSTGFAALPGGDRHRLGNFNGKGNRGNWWSNTPKSQVTAFFFTISDFAYSGNSGIGKYTFIKNYNDKRMGLSVRLVKDN